MGLAFAHKHCFIPISNTIRSRNNTETQGNQLNTPGAPRFCVYLHVRISHIKIKGAGLWGSWSGKHLGLRCKKEAKDPE